MYVGDDIFSYKYKLKINIHVGILPYSSYVLCFFMQTSVGGMFDLELDLVHVHNGVLCSMYKSSMYMALSYIVHTTLNYISNMYLWGTWSLYKLNSTLLKFHSLDWMDRIVQTFWQVVIHMKTTYRTLPFARLRAFQNQAKCYNTTRFKSCRDVTPCQLVKSCRHCKWA
jgi:hypothetical protein